MHRKKMAKSCLALLFTSLSSSRRLASAFLLQYPPSSFVSASSSSLYRCSSSSSSSRCVRGTGIHHPYSSRSIGCTANQFMDRRHIMNDRLLVRTHASVTGIVYTVNDENDDNEDSREQRPVIKLFTKEGCTLCDKVKDVLQSIRSSHPHTLLAVDITDDEHSNWHSKYKYDIPVLHMNDLYWTKHALTKEDAILGFEEVSRSGGDDFWIKRGIGEPDADAMERRMEERRRNDTKKEKEDVPTSTEGGNWYD